MGSSLPRLQLCTRPTLCIHFNVIKGTVVIFSLFGIAYTLNLNFVLSQLTTNPVYAGQGKYHVSSADASVNPCDGFVSVNANTTLMTNFTDNHFLETIGFTGRFGNRLALVTSMIRTAQDMCCGVRLPTGILVGWQPSPRDITFANISPRCEPHTNKELGECKKRTAKEWYYLYMRNGTQMNQSRCADILLANYFQVNETHALGKRCPVNKPYVIHVRSGDIVKEVQHFHRNLDARQSLAQVRAYPTSYYDAAILKILSVAKQTPTPTIHVLCESLHSPTCVHLLKVARYLPQLNVRIGMELLEDLHLLLCAREVVTSVGTFRKALLLSASLENS